MLKFFRKIAWLDYGPIIAGDADRNPLDDAHAYCRLTRRRSMSSDPQRFRAGNDYLQGRIHPATKFHS